MTELNGALAVIEGVLRDAISSTHEDFTQQQEQALCLITAIREAMPDGLDNSLHIFDGASPNSRVYAAIKAAKILQQIAAGADD